MSSVKDILTSVIKDKKKLAALILGVFGIFLILLSLGGDGETQSDTESLEKYKRELEDELAELCESIDGAGRCRVSVTFASGEKLQYKGTSVISSEPPRVLGVSIVCEGGADPNIKRDISECMTSLFDIGSNRVCVLKMK